MAALDAVRRGDLAAEALGNAALKEALQKMRDDITAMWAAVPMRDVEGREHCWRLYMTTKKFEDLLKSYVESGKADRKMLEHQKSPLETVRRAVGF